MPKQIPERIKSLVIQERAITNSNGIKTPVSQIARDFNLAINTIKSILGK